MRRNFLFTVLVTIVHFLSFILFADILQAQIELPQQPKCGCPQLSLYVFDTKMNFKTDSAVEKDNYSKAKKSGDHLKSDYAKQKSDGLTIVKGTATSTGSAQIDFTSNAEIDRNGSNGNYSYTVNVKLIDAYTKNVVVDTSQITDDLAKANDMIDSCVKTFTPVLDSTIRKYQKKLRKESGYQKWVGLQWQAKADNKNLEKGKATQVTITVIDCIDKKPVPNLPVHISQTDPNTGFLSISQANTNDSGKVALVFTARNKGETMILPSFSYTGINNILIHTPTVCADQKITVDGNFYKITMDAEYSVDGTGRNINLHGECISSLKILADSTQILEPVDQTRNMNIEVKEADAVNANGASGKLITPWQYTIPFLFTIAKGGKGTMYLNTTSPQSGQVVWLYTGPGGTEKITCDIDKGAVTYDPGQTVGVPRAAGSLYAMDGLTNLNVIMNLMADQNLAKQNLNQNISNGQDQMAFAKRMQAHLNDPAYFKTPQGKADMKRMQSFNQQTGGAIVNASTNTKSIDSTIGQNMKNDPNYIGSDQFRQDIGKSQLSRIADEGISQNSAMAQVSPGTALVRIEGSFKPKGPEVFLGNLESSVGPMKTTVKIKIEKIDSDF